MLSLGVAGLSLSACGGGGVACKDAAKAPSYAASVERIVVKACQDCHSAGSKNREGAPASSNYDTPEQVKREAAEMASRISNKSMPPATASATMTAAERETFEQWVACGSKP